MNLLVAVVKRLFSLRYDVKIKGLENIKKGKNYLVMPNHVSMVDPELTLLYLWKYTKLHPVTNSSIYYHPLLKPLLKLVGALPIADMEKEKGCKEDTEEAFSDIAEKLGAGESILLYPSGMIARQGYESIIGKKAAYHVMSALPDTTRVLGLRIQGLWGSSASKAWNGKEVLLRKYFLRGLCSVIANLIFFVPKRKVTIEIKDITEETKSLHEKGLDIFNSGLEQFYNIYGEEKAKYISYLSYCNTVKNKKEPTEIPGSIKNLQRIADYSDFKYSKELFHAVIKKIKEIKPDYDEEITINTNLILDLSFDSLDMAELKAFITATNPGASNPPLLGMKVVGDFLMMAIGKSPYVEKLKPCKRTYDIPSKVLYEDWKDVSDQETILTLFKKSFSKNQKTSFCYDTIFGVQSRKDFLIKAYLIADLLKKSPEKYIGIMLPSLSGTALLIMATYLAKKVPVMLNWTQGEVAFAHCVKNKKISAIFTSSNFFKKIETPWLKKYDMVFFEDMLKKISLSQKLKALLGATLFHIPKATSSEAVVLFTSGSEALPKTVTLTHQNIIQDLKGALGILDVTTRDVLFGFLPPFHSFGFSINTMLPLISGIRTVYFPDPNDSQTIANLIEETKASLLPSTPTFLRGIISSAKGDQLSSLSLAVVGAEKCPEDVFTEFSKKVPEGTIVEGYGITECAPIISANPFHKGMKIKKGSAGIAIKGLDIKVLDLETQKLQKIGQEGMVYVSGANVFGGYEDPKLESPFIAYEGKTYYKTGDLGYLDKDHYLYITGRLKRFVKIAGEMVSLPRIEGLLLEKYGSHEEVNIALEAKEHGDGSVTFVLFSLSELNVKEVNTYLKSKGVPNLVKIDHIHQLDTIPILGTGKTDYKVLKAMIE